LRIRSQAFALDYSRHALLAPPHRSPPADGDPQPNHPRPQEGGPHGGPQPRPKRSGRNSKRRRLSPVGAQRIPEGRVSQVVQGMRQTVTKLGLTGNQGKNALWRVQLPLWQPDPHAV